jgi:hypothetical protein
MYSTVFWPLHSYILRNGAAELCQALHAVTGISLTQFVYSVRYPWVNIIVAAVNLPANVIHQRQELVVISTTVKVLFEF